MVILVVKIQLGFGKNLLLDIPLNFAVCKSSFRILRKEGN